MKKFVLMAAAALTVVSLACSCGKDKSSDKDSTETTKTTETTETKKTDNSAAGQFIAIIDKAVADAKADPANAKTILEEASKKCDEILNGLSDKEREELEKDPKTEAALEKLMVAMMEAATQEEAEAEMTEEVSAEPMTEAPAL